MDLKKTIKKICENIKYKSENYMDGSYRKCWKYVKKIDVFCMNSRFEGLGLVMLEAMFFQTNYCS